MWKPSSGESANSDCNFLTEIYPEGKYVGKLHVTSAVKVAISGSKKLSVLPLGSLLGYLIR